MTIAPKALIGAAVAFLGSVQASLDGGITAQEWIAAAIVGLVALGGVYVVPKTSRVGGTRGAVDVLLLVVVVLVGAVGYILGAKYG